MTETERYLYSVIRYVPDIVRAEFINIGIIAGADDDWHFQLSKPVINRLPRHPSCGAIPLDYISSLIDPKLFTPSFSAGLIKLSQQCYRDIIQFSPPLPILSASSEAAIDRLWPLFVEGPSFVHPYIFQEVQWLADRLKKAGNTEIANTLYDFSRVITGAEKLDRDECGWTVEMVQHEIEQWNAQR